ncbi:AAA family ATPase [Longirhabdus pacifica]|uniref:AAA family ATPase n=1 Tax=Longirhabdus pacifica TaxID=2305227 RepID=UPI001008E90A|nr:MoxR family ATPase [Longirhabdus pacifica]
MEDLKVIHHIVDNMEKCIYGKREEIEIIVTALLAQGHILLEDVPGTGKTVLMKSLAKSIEGDFHRIQCNPDLLPTDITGVSIYHPREEDFTFRPGPVMTNLLLVDEINRATTKTQSALLEAMEERQITMDGKTYALPHPFLVMATQNSIDFEGTYTLPEAQLDRFMFRISVGYPDKETEMRMILEQNNIHPLQKLQAVTDVNTLVQLQRKVQEVHLDAEIVRYGVDIVRMTRRHAQIALGASPRATVALFKAAKAHALVRQRNYVIPDDIKQIAPYLLGHRIKLKVEAMTSERSEMEMIDGILNSTKVPMRLVK